MPYIGRDLNRGNYLKLDDISSSFNGSTQTFNLTVGGSAFTPGSAFSILVSLGGVIQEPESAYQVNNSEITFANAPTAQDSFFCIALGVALGIGVPGSGTVNGPQMAKPFNYDGFFYLNDANNRVGINSSSPSETLDIIGNTKISGIVTATEFSGQLSNASGISTFYNLRVTNNLTVEGTTTTLDTDLTGVDRVEINANSNSNAAIVGIQSGSAEIVKLLDGTDEVLKVNDGGLIDIASYIRHIGATGTSIGFPDTGSRIIATTNGSTRFTLDGDGRILVGITTATFLASQGGSDLLIEKAVGAGGTVSIDIYSKNATGNSFVRFYNGSQSGKIGLVGIGHSLTFCTAGVNSERMRLTNVGLGVNNNNPKSRLTVGTGLANSETGGILVQNVVYSSNQDKPYLIAGSQNWTGATTNWGTYGFQHRLKVDSGGSPRVTIDNQNGEIICFHSNKRVGIGTDNPLSLLHVHGEGGNTSGLMIRNAYDVVRQYFNTNSNDSTFLITYDGTGGAELTLHADGSLGLNESNGDDVFVGANQGTGYAKFSVSKSASGITTAIGLSNGGGDGSRIMSSKTLVLSADHGNDSGTGQSYIGFETDGTEKIRIDSNGRLLIGHDTNQSDFHGPQTTTNRNPVFQLHGSNASSAAAALISWNSNATAYYSPTLYLAHSGSNTKGTNGILPANGEFGSIVFSGDDGTDFVKGAIIKARLDGTPGNNDMPGRLEFHTTPDGAQAPIKRMIIQSTGIVKVETSDSSSFNAHFLVNNSESNSGVSLIGSGSSFNAGGWAPVTDAGIIRSSANSSNGLVLQAATGDMRFYVGASGSPSTYQERFRITSTGTVGVNCTPTAAPLEVKQLSADGGALRLRDSSATYRYLEFDVTGATTTITARSNNSHGNINIGTIDQFGRTTQLYIKGGQNAAVGIGTENPQCVLDINKDITGGVNYVDIRNHASLAGAALRVRTQGSYNTPMYDAIVGASDSGGTIRMGAVSNHELLLLTNNTPRVTISTAGLLTIKNFSGGTGLRLEGSGSNYIGMQLQTTDSSTSQTRNVFIDAVNETGVAVANQVGSVESDGGSSWSWQTQPPGDRTSRREERLRITSSGNVNIGTGELDQTTSGRLLNVYGGQIRVRQTSSGNTLEVFGNSTSGQSYGLLTNAGTTANDYSARFRSNSGTVIMQIQGDEKVGIMNGSPFNRFCVGGHTFNGGHGMYSNSRVGMSNHGSLTGLMLASTYNDGTHPEYGLVFIQGPNTSSYNVWSISPDGPAKGNDLNLHYGAQATNIHVPTARKFAFTGAGQFLAPYQPSFCAKGITSHTNPQNPVDYTQEIFDIGDNYDPTAGTSAFTAPVTGKYFFHATVMFDNNFTDFGYIFMDFVYDGNTTGRERMMPRPSGGSFATIENSGIFHMVAGKTMQVRTNQSGGTLANIRNDYRFFEGYLIG